MKLELETVIPTEEQVEALYRLLRSRRHTISHEQVPSYKEHCWFVENNPYRAWFIVKIDNAAVGNVYVQYDNSVALNNLEDIDLSLIDEIMVLISERLTPLDSIPSVRYKDFFINVAATNKNLRSKLEGIGYKPSQVSYILDLKVTK
jgi:hypothetical protein